MRAKRLAALLCALVFLVPALAVAADNVIQEKATKVPFPVTRSVPEAQAPLQLTGTGVRVKIVFKVYAFGFYVDPAAAKTALAKWAGKGADALANDPSFYAALATAPVDRLAVMHFVRDVDIEKMHEAMNDAMDRGVPKNDPARKAFLDLFKGTISSGEDLALLFDHAGKVTLIRNWKAVGSVTSPALSRSVLESWLGPKPISDDIHSGLVARFPEILK